MILDGMSWILGLLLILDTWFCAQEVNLNLGISLILIFIIV